MAFGNWEHASDKKHNQHFFNQYSVVPYQPRLPATYPLGNAPHNGIDVYGQQHPRRPQQSGSPPFHTYLNFGVHQYSQPYPQQRQNVPQFSPQSSPSWQTHHFYPQSHRNFPPPVPQYLPHWQTQQDFALHQGFLPPQGAPYRQQQDACMPLFSNAWESHGDQYPMPISRRRQSPSEPPARYPQDTLPVPKTREISDAENHIAEKAQSRATTKKTRISTIIQTRKRAPDDEPAAATRNSQVSLSNPDLARRRRRRASSASVDSHEAVQHQRRRETLNRDMETRYKNREAAGEQAACRITTEQQLQDLADRLLPHLSDAQKLQMGAMGVQEVKVKKEIKGEENIRTANSCDRSVNTALDTIVVDHPEDAKWEAAERSHLYSIPKFAPA